EAIDAYRKSVEADPENLEVHRDLGDALAPRGNLDEAITSYRKVIGALGERGKLDEAIASSREARVFKPRNLAAYAYFKIGTIFYRQKKMPEAIAASHRALELDHDNMTSAYHNIGTAL